MIAYLGNHSSAGPASEGSTDRRIASSFGFSDSHRSFDDIDVGLA